MTEQDWHTSHDLRAMLQAVASHWTRFLFGWTGKQQARERKLRLFACACSRRDCSPGVGDVIDVAEKYADGQASKEELRQARRAINTHLVDTFTNPSDELAALALSPFSLDVNQVYTDAHMINWAGEHVESAPVKLLRDIFFNPLSPPPSLSPSVLGWNDSIVKRLAMAIYDENAFWTNRMNVLADALVDAGCDNDDILEHCRGDGLHAKGCFVVDLLLGKS